MYLLGLDLGSTVCKSSIFDVSGDIVCISREEFSSALSHPRRDWVEFDPNIFWHIVSRNLRNSIKAAHLSPKEIAGMSVSASGELFVPVSSNGNPVCKAIHWSDKRDAGYRKSLQIIKRFGTLRTYKITGYPFSAMPSLPKVLWLRQNRPNLFRKIGRLLLLEDFVNLRLTGNSVTDYSLAMTSQMFDITKKDWSDEILDEMKISREILPDVYPSGKPVGEVLSEASKDTGLARGTIVATGGLDQCCGALGIGVTSEGEAFNTTGTCEIVAAASDKPVLHERGLRSGIFCCPHVVENKYLLLGVLPSSGSTLKWFKETFGEVESREAERNGSDPYSLIVEKAADSQPGSGGIFMLPHFDGSGSGIAPAFNSESKGVFFGLTLSSRKSDIIRALLEGITFEARLYFEALEELGLKVRKVKAMGGGAKSKLWLQMKADIFGKKVVLPDVIEGSSLGAALLAGLSCGVYSSVKRATSEICKYQTILAPSRKRLMLYDEYYRLFKGMYPVCLPLFKSM